MRTILAAMLAVASSIPSTSWAAGDPARGEVLHRSCLQCHGTEVYVPPKRRVQSLPALRKETARWADYYNPAFTKSEVEDLVAYLNRDFYRFP